MKRLWLLLALVLALAAPASAQLTMTGVGGGFGASSGVTCSSSEGNAFLARLTGSPDNTHKTAYCTLIDGLVTDGVWTKLDALYMFATDTSANALLNLVSATGNATNVSTTFTADAGFQGNGSNQYVNTNMSSTQFVTYTQNSAHLSVWGKNAAPTTPGASGFLDAGPTNSTFLGTGDAGASSASGQINQAFSGGASDPNTNQGAQHHMMNRSAASGAGAIQMYTNGVSVQTGSSASTAVITGLNIWIGCRNFNGSTNSCSNQQFMMASIGGSLNGGSDAANFYARVHTYLQTIAGIP